MASDTERKKSTIKDLEQKLDAIYQKFPAREQTENFSQVGLDVPDSTYYGMCYILCEMTLALNLFCYQALNNIFRSFGSEFSRNRRLQEK